MTYKETLEYLYTMLPMYQSAGKIAYKADLSNTIRLLDALDNPHRKFKSIHIAGTNGKGTSAHGTAAILQTAGYKTGLCTSPHLKNYTERIRINGTQVAERYIVDFIKEIKLVIDKTRPSFFEVTVVMAFHYFAQEKVDVAVVETGLGGRLDSTNVLAPEVCLITNIGLEHTDILGGSLREIASEKAGIIKKATPVVIGEYHKDTYPVFKQVANEQHATLTLANADINVDLPLDYPHYFKRNISGILAVVDELVKKNWSIPKHAISNGLRNMKSMTGLKGRFQILNKTPLMIADVSHNKEGMEVLLSQLDGMLTTGQKLHVIFGTVRDKDLSAVFKLFSKRSNSFFYWTQPSIPRGLPASVVENHAHKYGLKGESFTNVNLAMDSTQSKATSQDLILITGSTFVVAEIDRL